MLLTGYGITLPDPERDCFMLSVRSSSTDTWGAMRRTALEQFNLTETGDAGSMSFAVQPQRPVAEKKRAEGSIITRTEDSNIVPPSCLPAGLIPTLRILLAPEGELKRIINAPVTTQQQPHGGGASHGDTSDGASASGGGQGGQGGQGEQGGQEGQGRQGGQGGQGRQGPWGIVSIANERRVYSSIVGLLTQSVGRLEVEETRARRAREEEEEEQGRGVESCDGGGALGADTSGTLLASADGLCGSGANESGGEGGGSGGEGGGRRRRSLKVLAAGVDVVRRGELRMLRQALEEMEGLTAALVAAMREGKRHNHNHPEVS